jgi:hypothetical protein
MVYNLYGKHINSSKVVNNKVTKKCSDLSTHKPLEEQYLKHFLSLSLPRAYRRNFLNFFFTIKGSFVMLLILKYVTKLSPSLAPRHICSQVGQLFAYFFTTKKSVDTEKF